MAGAEHGGAPEQRRPRTRDAPATPEAPASESRERAPGPVRPPRGQGAGSDPSADAERSWAQAGDAQPPSWAQQPAPRSPQDTGSVPAPVPARGASPVHSGGDIPAQDDDDLENSTTVGQSVIESVLGGKVIEIDDPTQR